MLRACVRRCVLDMYCVSETLSYNHYPSHYPLHSTPSSPALTTRPPLQEPGARRVCRPVGCGPAGVWVDCCVCAERWRLGGRNPHNDLDYSPPSPPSLPLHSSDPCAPSLSLPQSERHRPRRRRRPLHQSGGPHLDAVAEHPVRPTPPPPSALASPRPPPGLPCSLRVGGRASAGHQVRPTPPLSPLASPCPPPGRGSSLFLPPLSSGAWLLARISRGCVPSAPPGPHSSSRAMHTQPCAVCGRVHPSREGLVGSAH